jgi:hypothetical protein
VTSLDDVLAAARTLHDELDEVIEAVDDIWAQSQVDWVWFRLSTIGEVLRDRGGGPVAAVLARGLLEEAAYWDWALATGVGGDLVPRQAALELDRLHRLADSVGDTVWTGWILPPGASLGASGTEGIPRSAADAVNRLGGGLDEACLGSLRFKGLFAAYRLLEVLTHGGLAAAYVLRSGGGEELSDQLAAAIVHVACAGACGAVIAQLGLVGAARTRLDSLSADVASMASAVHGLPLGGPRPLRAPAKAGPMTPIEVTSEIERLPRAQDSTTEAAADFLGRADELARVASAHVRSGDRGAWLAWPAFQMAWSQLHVLRGVVEGTLAKALLPFAARPLLEEGARWGWLGLTAAARAQPGAGLHAIVDDSRQRVEKVRNSLATDDIPRDRVDHLLGGAIDLLRAAPVPAPTRLPPLSEMLATAHPSSTGVDTANPLYSLLSQFVHPSPLAVLHLRRDLFPSLSAPMYAVAVEASCRGFTRTASSTLAICCEPNDELSTAVDRLTGSLGRVVFDAMRWHFLG